MTTTDTLTRLAIILEVFSVSVALALAYDPTNITNRRDPDWIVSPTAVWYWPPSWFKPAPKAKWVKGKQSACAMPEPREVTVWLNTWTGATA